MKNQILTLIASNDHKAIAKAISLIENSVPGFEELLKNIKTSPTPIIGITGPPGAGKSTLVDMLTHTWSQNGKKVAVLCVDPSSPFHSGALLGDRIRMSKWFNNPDIFIRSLASRGALGGLHPKIIEISELLKASGFDYIIIETVGVGQSEIEIAGLADVTIVAMVPEGGDDIQTMKSGLMEIADIFVLNKADRPGADQFAHTLQQMLAPAFSRKKTEIPIIKTIATSGTGVDQLAAAINEKILSGGDSEKKYELLTDKAYHLIREQRMKDVSKSALKEKIRKEGKDFNLYAFAETYPSQPQ